MSEDRRLLASRALVCFDLRALALFRICIGCCCLVDLGRRWPWIEAFYSNIGVWSNHFSLFDQSGHSPMFSLLHAFSSPFEVRIFFILSAVVAAAFTVGYRTRAMQLLLLVMMISVINRNRIMIYGADSVIIAMLLATIPLPLGERWSVCRGESHGLTNRRDSFLFLLPTVQLAAIYLLTGFQKNGATWMEGTAVHYFLHQDRIVTTLGVLFREHAPTIALRSLTILTVIIERVAPFLILSPLATSACRRLAFYVLCAFHLGLAIVSNLGIFPLVMIASLTVLLQSPELDWIEKTVHARFRSFAALGKYAVPPGNSPEYMQAPLWTSFYAVAFLVIAANDLVRANPIVAPIQGWKSPQSIQSFVDYSSFRQGWGMFSPDAPVDDQRLVFEIVLADGSTVDLFTGGPSIRDFPPTGSYPWNQLIDHYQRIAQPENRGYLVEFDRWCRERRGGFEAISTKSIARYQIFEVTRAVPAPGATGPEPSHLRLIQAGDCG